MLSHHHRQLFFHICTQVRGTFPAATNVAFTNPKLIAHKLFATNVTSNNQPVSEAFSNPASVTQKDEEFRTLDIVKSRSQRGPARGPRRIREKREALPPRYKKMAFDQDWHTVWPIARTFHPATVPLPVHQGFTEKLQAAPGKFANAELMKIPNFLHLTPPAIKRHCEAIKKFCTPWPAELEDNEVNDYFPVEIVTTDYCHSSPSINDKRARIVMLKVKLSYLDLDEHAKDKFKRLVGDRYDLKSDYITILCDSCPLRQQNLDYAMYILTALYHESLKIDVWEAEKLEDDMEKYVWEGSPSHSNLTEILAKVSAHPSSKPSYLKQLEGKVVSPESMIVVEPVQQYRDSTVAVHNKGETVETIEEYGKSVRKLFNLTPTT